MKTTSIRCADNSVKLLALAMVAAVAVMGPGSGAEAASVRSGPTGFLLSRTLLAVSNDPALHGVFEFGDVATQRMLAGIPAGRDVAGNRIWDPIVGDGATVDNTNVTGKSVHIGVSPLTVDVALSVGTPPHLAVEARGGVNPSALRAALLHLGAKAGAVAGRAGLVLGAEGALHPNLLGSGPDGFDTALALGRYDRTVLGPDLVVAGNYSGPVADLLGGNGPTFGSNPVMVATVSCLGDVIAAFGQNVRGTEVAVGVLRPVSASTRPVEEICAVPSSSAAATADATGLRQSLAGRTSTVPNLTELLQTLSRSAVTLGAAGSKRFVRATLYDRPNVPAGVSIHAFELDAVPKMLGASSAPDH
jgi:hypothetical protein